MLAVLSQAEPGSLKVSYPGLARLPGRGVAGAGGAVRGVSWVAVWVADERWRALFGVARRCSASLFWLVTRVSAGGGLGVAFMACKRPGVRVPLAPRFRSSEAIYGLRI